MYYIKRVVIFLFIGLTFFSCLNSCVAENTNATNLIIDDTNYDSYFNSDGHLIANIFQGNTIYLGNLSNKEIILDSPLEITSYNESSILNNCSIKISEDAYGAHIFNLKFFNVIDKDNSKFFAPIYINQSYNNLIENNIIKMEFSEDSYYTLAGIYAFGESINNTICLNRVSINCKSESGKHYIYGIEFASAYSGGGSSKANSYSNKIYSNIIDSNSDYYSAGIYLSCSNDAIINNNEIYLTSLLFDYGIVCEWSPLLGSLTKSNNFTISNNMISATASMVYAIEVFDVDDVNIVNNTITTISNASYGIAGYNCINHSIYGNNVNVSGTNISLVTNNFDAIASGHNGIYYMRNSKNIIISNNNILSNYVPGGDYAIRFDDSSVNNISVFNNNLSSNHQRYIGNLAVYGKVKIKNNDPYLNSTNNTINYEIVSVYVSVNGSDVKGNGSYNNPFLTINKALLYLKNLNLNKTTNLKGLIYISKGTFGGFGSNIRLYINDLVLDIIGNNTIIDGEKTHWFFEISKSSTVSIKNINFHNGVLRTNNAGLINNKGILNLENCNFNNSRVCSSSAIVYNSGILFLKNNTMSLVGKTGYVIYNTGKIDNLILYLMGNSPDEINRTVEINSSKVKLVAYLTDDMGNPVSGGSIRFYIESKSFGTDLNLLNGVASLDAYISVYGNLRVTGTYSNVYTNLFINIGRIINRELIEGVVFYVSINGSDENGDGSYNNPFKTINKALTLVNSAIEDCTIKLSSGVFKESLNKFNSKNKLTILGVYNETYVASSWTINTNSTITIKNLIFNKVSLHNYYASLTIDNCLFKNSVFSALTSYGANLTVLNCDFISNQIKSNHFISYRNYTEGGAIYNSFGCLTIVNSNFFYNQAMCGAAIYNNQSNLYISTSNFVGNVAFQGFTDSITYSYGGAIVQYLAQEVIISDCVFLNNSANGYGGAFYSSGIFPNSTISTSLLPEHDYIHKYDPNMGYINNFGNVVENQVSPQDIYFINCIFDTNLAPKGGGAVYIIENYKTHYIGCSFSNNLVYTYNLFNKGARNWIYNDELENIYNLVFVPTNNGGAIYDKNVDIKDSTFSANTFEAGGSIILPSIITYSNELKKSPINQLGTAITNNANGGESIHVADSSLLTGEDSVFLGISGWKGTSTGPSISKNIDKTETGPSSGGSGTGTGNTGSGTGSISGSSSGGSGSGSISGKLGIGDILSYLGSSGNNIVLNNGNGVTLADIINSLKHGSNSSNTNSNNNGSGQKDDGDIKINGTTNDNNPSGGSTSSGGSPTTVGSTSNSLTGVSDVNTASAKDASSSQKGLEDSSSDSAASSKGGSYEIEKVNKKMEFNTVQNISAIIIILFVLILFILGFYKHKKEDKEE